MYPNRLKPNSHIRIIAPSLSAAIISSTTMNYACKRFKEMGFIVSFGEHISEIDNFGSSSIQSRVEDLHNAFEDQSVDAILTIIGGYNCNQLLDKINWSSIKNNPKIFCGYSDITILHNAIFSQTGLITYYGPHFSTFGQKILDNYETDYFLKGTASEKPYLIEPSKNWSNDKWYLDQDNRNFIENTGYWVIQEGQATGQIVGGHLGTFCLLQGTRYMPTLENKILIIEEDSEPANPNEFARRLQSILQQPSSNKIAGVLIGRFEKSYGMTQAMLSEIVKTITSLADKPIIANVDFGHTEPHCTIPIGGAVELTTQNNKGYIRVLNR